MSAERVSLENRVRALEKSLQEQESQHARELQKLQEQVEGLKRLTHELEDANSKLDVVGTCSQVDHYLRKVEWTISDFSAVEAQKMKGQSISSPKFAAAGLTGLQLELFPKGREKTTHEGFCSLFFWCPPGTRIKYQLWVGRFLRAPDFDEYTTFIGRGHSDFCPLAPEIDRAADCLRVGVDLMDVFRDEIVASRGLKLISTSLEAMVAREAEVIQNRSINRVVWKIRNASEKLKQFPQGSQMISKLFTAAGISDILLEFYPGGSAHTSKEGFCAFYVRCPLGVSVIITLFVGKVRKGPIKATFDGPIAKGLPDFCPLLDEIEQSDDSLEVGIEIQHQPAKTLTLES